jgi:CRISPR-associated protein Cas1
LIDRVIFQGSHQLNSATLGRIVSKGASVLFLTGRQSRFVATMTGALHADAGIRLRQYQLCCDPQLCAAWSRRLILAKVRAQRAVLMRILGVRPDLRHFFMGYLSSMQEDSQSVASLAEINHASILGLEGAAARSYFQAFSTAFPESLTFSGRTRRPPRDPVNTCLSLSYTLLFGEAIIAAYRAGLDPALGFFHRPAYGRASLACDLIEPLRPRADFWVWSLFRDRTLRPEHFSSDGEACRLGKTGRSRFYIAYEQVAGPTRRQLRRYTARLVRAIRCLPDDSLRRAYPGQRDAFGSDAICDSTDFDSESYLASREGSQS